MNKEMLKQEISNKLDVLSKEELVSLLYFLVVVYSMFTSLVQNLGMNLDKYSEAFGKTSDEEGKVANEFFSGLRQENNDTGVDKSSNPV